MAGGMHGRGHAWQRDMHGKGVCMAGRCVWQGGMYGTGCAWQGGMHGSGV